MSDSRACRTNDVKTRLSHLTRRSPVSDEGGWRRRVVAYGKTMWFRHPLLVSNRRRCCEPNRVSQAVNPPMTVTRRIRRREEHGISRKAATQGMPDASAEPVCSCAHPLSIAHETAGAVRTRHSLRPLFSRVTSIKTRAHCAARLRKYDFHEAERVYRERASSSNPHWLYAIIFCVLSRD